MSDTPNGHRGEPLTDPDNELGTKSLTIPARVVETRQIEAPSQTLLAGVPRTTTAIKHVITIVPQNRGNQAFQIEVEPGRFSAGEDITLIIQKA